MHFSGAAQPSAVPKEELRGVFLTTSNSLDWPKSYDRTEQQASLRKIVRDMKAANLNAIFFQVRARGDAYYRSKFEPWAENLTGALGKDPGWDPLAFLLNEAHQAGIEVHAWFNAYKIRGPVAPAQSAPLHPMLAFPDWVVQYETEVWLDPGIPEVRQYLLWVLTDLVNQYEIDGVCFDFIRYPGEDFSDWRSYMRFGNGTPIGRWRRENINALVREAYLTVAKLKPRAKVGAAPIGNPGGDLSMQPDAKTAGGGPDWFAQDAHTWLKNGWLDYVVPQVYWELEFNTRGPDFAHITRTWKKIAGERHVYVGIGAFKPEIAEQIPDQIQSARMLGTHGQVYFRYENIETMDIFGGMYTEPVPHPHMAWKDTSSKNTHPNRKP